MERLWVLLGCFSFLFWAGYSAAENSSIQCPKILDRPFFASAEDLPETEEGMERDLGPGGYQYLASTLTGLAPEEQERSGLALKDFLRGKSETQDGCLSLEFVLPSFGTLNKSFDDLHRASEHIVLGTIEKATPGFHSEFPGSLLTIRIQEQFKGSESRTSIQVFYLGGSFELWGFDVCSTINGISEAPPVGSSLVVFYGPSQRGELCPVVAPHASAWILDTEGQQIQTGASYFGRRIEMTPKELILQLKSLSINSP